MAPGRRLPAITRRPGGRTANQTGEPDEESKCSGPGRDLAADHGLRDADAADRRRIPPCRAGIQGKTEELTVKRRFRDVAVRPQRPEWNVCTRSQTTTSYQYIVAVYKPTVLVSQQRAELHVQENHQRGVLKVYEEPEGATTSWLSTPIRCLTTALACKSSDRRWASMG